MPLINLPQPHLTVSSLGVANERSTKSAPIEIATSLKHYEPPGWQFGWAINMTYLCVESIVSPFSGHPPIPLLRHVVTASGIRLTQPLRSGSFVRSSLQDDLITGKLDLQRIAVCKQDD